LVRLRRVQDRAHRLARLQLLREAAENEDALRRGGLDVGQRQEAESAELVDDVLPQLDDPEVVRVRGEHLAADLELLPRRVVHGPERLHGRRRRALGVDDEVVEHVGGRDEEM
jgi:hypothetical protein